MSGTFHCGDPYLCRQLALKAGPLRVTGSCCLFAGTRPWVSLIGTIYGGDGALHNRPAQPAKRPMHPGHGPGLTTRQVGQRGGTETSVQPPRPEAALLASANPPATR